MAILNRKHARLALATLGFLWASAAHAAGELMALCYHEVEPDRAATVTRTAVLASDLAAQFEWLRANGYTPVSLQQWLDARAGRGSLPEKAVLQFQPKRLLTILLNLKKAVSA